MRLEWPSCIGLLSMIFLCKLTRYSQPAYSLTDKAVSIKIMEAYLGGVVSKL